jgi:hypothetical protein
MFGFLKRLFGGTRRTDDHRAFAPEAAAVAATPPFFTEHAAAMDQLAPATAFAPTDASSPEPAGTAVTEPTDPAREVGAFR